MQRRTITFSCSLNEEEGRSLLRLFYGISLEEIEPYMQSQIETKSAISALEKLRLAMIETGLDL